MGFYGERISKQPSLANGAENFENRRIFVRAEGEQLTRVSGDAALKIDFKVIRR